ncbi:formylglycine-generating enzyme family protein [Candidatus Sumerlaeota bacterium]|nr:formylglycine-generating enzyme family protein [Candidatus Sumerlaeota bacterium]
MTKRLHLITLAMALIAASCDTDGAEQGEGGVTLKSQGPQAPALEEEITNSIGMRLRLIPAGSFTMGSPPEEPGRTDDEGPQHTVTFQEPFHMGVHEVTVEQFRLFVEATGHRLPAHWNEQSPNPDHPVVYVSWDDAMALCEWLSEEESATYRLPSEAEWEYACRAGTSTAYSTGSTISTDQANIERAAPDIQDVGSYPPNGWGLCDMHGNVWEWCLDQYHSDYTGAPMDGSAWESPEGTDRVLRGGSWGHIPQGSRSAGRGTMYPDDRGSVSGFRVVREL